MVMRQILPDLKRFISRKKIFACVSARTVVTCVFSKETVKEERQWVEKRVANAKLWWYRSSKDRLPCPDGAECKSQKCKLLHPICLVKNCVDKYCRYSHQTRANHKVVKKEEEKIVLVGK